MVNPWIPAPRLRSAKPKNLTQFLNLSLLVEHLINPVHHTWNVDLLNAYIHHDDVKIIRGLAVAGVRGLPLMGGASRNQAYIR